jgi:predicted MFS family arabinose efflux permease
MPAEPTRLRDLSSQQRKSGLAAWLGWLFDGLDMHIYTMVAVAFVAILVNREPVQDLFFTLGDGAPIPESNWPKLDSVDDDHDGRVTQVELLSHCIDSPKLHYVPNVFLLAIKPPEGSFLSRLDQNKDGVITADEWPSFAKADQNHNGQVSRDEWEIFVASFHTGDKVVQERTSWIQAAFLIGWALGGAFFGRLGDLIGRSRALSLTILAYALFTGLSFFAQTWWHLLLCRFLAALGIGGEWAVGSTLLAETWPRRWRPWTAAVLQTAVNIGILFAVLVNTFLAGQHPRWIFLIGVVPAALVFYIRRHVPEPETWASAHSTLARPSIAELFRGSIRHTTITSIGVCAFSLTAWWAFLFWQTQYIRVLPAVVEMSPAERDGIVTAAFGWLMCACVLGNFVAGALAFKFGYKATLCFMFGGFVVTMCGTFGPQHSVTALTHFWIPAVGFWSGVFGLFTMLLPPLFPTLLRTTGAGFCYNIGRIAAAFGTIYAAQITSGTNYGKTLFYDGFLFLPAMIFALLLPTEREPEPAGSTPERSIESVKI